MTESERKRVINDLYSVQVSTSLLYVTPEQAATDFFKVCQFNYNRYNWCRCTTDINIIKLTT